MTTPTPHSADALKQDDCRAEFEAWALAEKVAYRDEQHGICFYDGSARAHQWIGWQAAWNRRPTPASDLCADLNAERINLNAGAKESTFIDIGALRGKLASMDENGFGSIRFTLDEARALLDRVERAEAGSKHYSMGADAEAKSADEWRERALRAEAKINYERKPDDSQQWAQLDGAVAWHLIDRHADDWSEIGNMMESWLAARMKRAEAAAGAVPEGGAIGADGTRYHNVAETYHQAENAECLQMWLDDRGVPRSDDGGELSLVGRVTRFAAPPAQGLPVAPSDPMDWPLPCDVTVGCGTISKGVPLRTLVLRMKNMNDMIREGWASARAPAAAPSECRSNGNAQVMQEQEETAGGAGSAAPSEPVVWHPALKAAADVVMALPLREGFDNDACKAMAITANAAILNLATPPAQDAGTGEPVKIKEPGHSDSLADRIFNLPCRWDGDPSMEGAVQLGHTMACEQAYKLVFSETSRAIANSGRTE